jgi:hypothetical protein
MNRILLAAAAVMFASPTHAAEPAEVSMSEATHLIAAEKAMCTSQPNPTRAIIVLGTADLGMVTSGRFSYPDFGTWIVRTRK